MTCNPCRFSRFAVLIFSAFLVLLKNNAHAIDQLDLILCGRKGNQYYVTSTPFITKGAYLYADLLIKAIEGPWPIKPNGAAMTLDEYKLEVVRKVILTSPTRLRLTLSRAISPENTPWNEIMGKMSKYPESLRIINDIRFSVFLCGPDLLDSPILAKLIEKVNQRYGYNFNPFSDKIIAAALRMHGVKDSTVKRKHALTEQRAPRAPRAQEREMSPAHKDLHGASPARPSENPQTAEERPVLSQRQSLVLNESEFEEFKDERSFESDYSKTPPFPEEDQRLAPLPKSADSPKVATSELPGTLLEDASASLPSSSELPDVSDIRVSRINKAGKYAASLRPETSASVSAGSLRNETLSGLGEKEDLRQKDIRDIMLPRNMISDESITIQSPKEVQVQVQPQIYSPVLEQGGVGDSGKVGPELVSGELVAPPTYYEPLDIMIPSSEDHVGNAALMEDARNYKEQEEVAKRLGEETEAEESLRNEGGGEAVREEEGEEDDDVDEEDEYEDFTSEEEYNQYLDYRDHRLTNKEEVESERLRRRPRELRRFGAGYPLGKREVSQRALLQDVSSVFSDLLNAVKTNRISDGNIAFGVPSINLKLNTRSKAIVIGDRIIKKWRAQNIDGVLKSIPIFHQGSFEELSGPPADQGSHASNSTRREESAFIEVDFNSAIRSHDKNEGGYVWTQRNLIATRRTAGFQDILIKAALEGLQALTSIQCSAILEMPISSDEVATCISAYFSSIHFGQNKVYGALTEDDEEKSIHGFEINKARMSQRLFATDREAAEASEEEYEDEDEDESLVGRRFAPQGMRSHEDKSSDLEAADDLIRKHLERTSNKIYPPPRTEPIAAWNQTAGSRDRRSQFSENSEELSDELSEEGSSSPRAAAAGNGTSLSTASPRYPFPEPEKEPSLSVPQDEHSLSGRVHDEDATPDSPEDEEGIFAKFLQGDEEAPGQEKAGTGSALKKHVDPEHIEKALEMLAINATEIYKTVSKDINIPINDLEPTIKSYDSFLDTVEIWSAITGEALIFTSKKMDGLVVSKSSKLSYFYSREEFYVYQAILNYSSYLVECMKTFVAIKQDLEDVRDMLKKSLTTPVSFESITSLSQKLDKDLWKYKNNFSNNIKLFCNELSIPDCLGIMRNDFYRRNEKFSSFIARHGSLKRVLRQVLEIFKIEVSAKDYISTYGGDRDDINRYALIKDYISKQVPIFTKKINKTLLKKQIDSDEKSAIYAVKVATGKAGLVSKRSICGEVRWEPKDKAKASPQGGE